MGNFNQLQKLLKAIILSCLSSKYRVSTVHLLKCEPLHHVVFLSKIVQYRPNRRPICTSRRHASYQK